MILSQQKKLYSASAFFGVDYKYIISATVNMDLKEQTGLMSTPQVDFFKENGVNLRFGPLI